MITNTEQFIIWLESIVVTQGGLVHENTLGPVARQSIESYQAQNLIQVEKLPINTNSKIAPTFTHRIRFTEEMWDAAHQYRREKAEQKTTTIPSRAESSAPLGGDKGVGSSNKQPDPHFIYEEFETFLGAHGKRLSPPQEDLVRKIFDVFNGREFNFFWSAEKSGKTFVLKVLDQYITSITEKRKKVIEELDAQASPKTKKKLSLFSKNTNPQPEPTPPDINENQTP